MKPNIALTNKSHLPAVHMKGAGVVEEIAYTSGSFFLAGTLLGHGLTPAFAAVFSVRGLWSMRRGLQS